MDMVFFIGETLLSNMGKYITFERSNIRHLFFYFFNVFGQFNHSILW